MSRENLRAYQVIAPVYEKVMGYRDDVEIVQELIRKYHPKARTLLELACGSGTMLRPLSRTYEVTGVDFSENMLNLCKHSMTHGKFHLGDMTTIRLGETFDLVLCVFDSLNHVLTFADWKKVFQTARVHMHAGSVFLFDINTKRKFENYEQETPVVEYHEEDFSIFNVRVGKRNTWDLEVRFFEKQRKGLFREISATIQEKTFPVERIKKELDKLFHKVAVRDELDRKYSASSESACFVCYS